MLIAATIALIFSGVAALFYAVNIRYFQPAAAILHTAPPDAFPLVSVLIPARDEASGISATLQCVLAQTGVQLEVLVLDDHSVDATAAVVQDVMTTDSRVRLLCGRNLSSGWCGKQYACQQLAEAAAYDEMVFLDADVRLEMDAISRAVAMRREQRLDLLSGFPRQLAETFGERLLLPLIQYILLCYLPFWAMRGTTRLSASAGCGQLFVTDRHAYRLAGGHAAIRSSLHDGVTLPRAYRRHGLMTDVFDASDVASVRMYRGFTNTWRGLSKNAVEGVAGNRLIVPVTALMFGAHILPFLLLGVAVIGMGSITATWMAGAAAVLSLIPRLATAWRFDRAWSAALLHPLSITVFLLIQWIAWFRSLRGAGLEWRGRAYAAARETGA